MKYVAMVTETDTDYTYALCEAETYDLLITKIEEMEDLDIRFNKKDKMQFNGWIFTEGEYEEGDYREPFCYETPIKGRIEEVV